MKYELIESPDFPGYWHVEAFDDEGECIKAVFSGPGAKARAEDYLCDIKVRQFADKSLADSKPDSFHDERLASYGFLYGVKLPK